MNSILHGSLPPKQFDGDTPQPRSYIPWSYSSTITVYLQCYRPMSYTNRYTKLVTQSPTRYEVKAPLHPLCNV